MWPTAALSRMSTPPSCARRSAARFRAGPTPPAEVHRRPRRRGGAGPGRHHRPAVLRLRDRRRAAVGDRGRHARGRLGPAARSTRSVAPAAAVAEEVAGGWLKDLLGLPATASVGFVTGAQAANTVGLAAARHHVLAEAGWDVERDGLVGAPRVRVIAGVERHAHDRPVAAPARASARRSSSRSPADANGAIDVDRAARRAGGRPAGPTIVVPAGGQREHRRVRRPRGRDGGRPRARRLGARRRRVRALGGGQPGHAASRRRASSSPTRGAATGTSGSTSPTTRGFVFCAHPEAHAAAMAYTAAYLAGPAPATARRRATSCPSRRAGPGASRPGRRCASSAATASPTSSTAAARWPGGSPTRLDAADGVEMVNDVVLNQVLVRFGTARRRRDRPDRGSARSSATATCWMGGTTWRGHAAHADLGVELVDDRGRRRPVGRRDPRRLGFRLRRDSMSTSGKRTLSAATARSKSPASRSR